MSPTPRSGKTRLPRGAQKRRREGGSAGQETGDARRHTLLEAERGTIFKDAPFRIALAYPLPYHAAMSSLGYQVVYRMLNSRSGISCERVVLPDDVPAARARGERLVSLESGRPLDDFDLVAVSMTWDLDILGLFDLMSLGGIPFRREDRSAWHPGVLIGGPLTASNPLPLSDFIDFAVIGDGEAAIPKLLDALEDATDRDDLLDRIGVTPGVWIPERDGDKVPPTQKVTVGLPAVGQIVTPHSELSNMFLVEASRGCPRFCKFCLVRSPESPMRESEVDRVMAAIPDWAPRVGFVGAAISEWSGIKEAMRRVVESGKGVGISSLRADRLDAEFVGLLARGGTRTMTVASDAPSQRQRNKMAKGIRTEHLLHAAQLARDAGMLKLKLYVIVGLPDETDADLDELIAFGKELSGILPTALGLSPLVPKLHTPLGDAPFAGMAAIDRTLDRLRQGLDGVAEIRSPSARWAWVEYRMSQGGAEAGRAALAAWREGGDFRAWERAMKGLPERPALDAARRHLLFAPAGMK
ncbi:MAG: radical SAM protein [Myxococcota bacterium]